MKRAAAIGGNALWAGETEPPISREAAGTEFGAEISTEAWSIIRSAYVKHAFRLQDLEGTRDNKNPNDTRGWGRRKRKAVTELNAALKGCAAINREFLDEADELYSMATGGNAHSYDLRRRLESVHDELTNILTVIERAEPLSREIPSEADSRRELARDVFAALESAGANLSNGWTLSQANPSHADLTGFEKLIELLEIHTGDTPEANAKWLREALAQRR
ncbi:hypothetical protein [Jannaschia pohangensis]|uniref:Uncharacterized protein n=1 Tax=Jannaschia pohangensis TaxID=390807 RepID=A0A1I3J6J6_9RHOB|nr:hypothetical protein [Jannaschia pohangensis]SFI55892.1 hypothetical protein SAMN04488095_1228 [Jannaschia pohangensis]